MMRNSLIIRNIITACKRLRFFYINSRTSEVLRRMGQGFRKYAASSRILVFFDREWNIGSAWKKSFLFRVVISPFSLYKFASDKLSDGTNSVLDGSRALQAAGVFLENLYSMSTRVYGLLFLTFAMTQCLLELAAGGGGPLTGLKGTIRLVLLLAGTVMILINRPVKALVEGSVTGGMAYNYFKVRGLENGTDDIKQEA